MTAPTRCLLAVALTAVAATATAAHPSRVSAEALRRHLTVLGGDALAGRAPGTPGGDAAAAYLRQQLAAAGVEPGAGDGGYLQPVPLVATRALPASRLVIETLGDTVELTLDDDYLLVTTGDQTLVPRPVRMVFAGYGIVAGEHDHDDYHDLDVRGAAVVVLDGEPPSDDPGYFAGPEPTVHSSLEVKQRTALARGAVATVVVPLPGPDQEAHWQRLRRDFAFAGLTLATSVPRHLCLVLHPERARELLAAALYDLDDVLAMHRRNALRSFHLPSRLSFTGAFASRAVLADNVLGRVSGRLGGRLERFVVVSAHYDHLGVGPAEDGDAIYNGVVDNALGVACTLEIGRVLAGAERRPRRSVLLLFTTAEEHGLLGARHFLDHPPVATTRVAAAVNVDGLAFLGPFRDLLAIGADGTDLASFLARAVRPLGLSVSALPAELGAAASALRSDQAAFADAGIPAILTSEGFDQPGLTREEAMARSLAWMGSTYHRPRDDLAQPLDLEAAREHCQAVLALVDELADSSSEPTWAETSTGAYLRALARARAGEGGR